MKGEAMSQRRVWELLRETRAILENDHFVYDSGRHGSAYVNKYAFLQNPEIASKLCEFLADEFVTKNVEVVAGNARGGIVVAQWVAYHLNLFRDTVSSGRKNPILAVFAEEEILPNGKKIRVFRHGFGKTVRGKRVLLVDDVLTTGSSIVQLSKAVEKNGGYNAGIGVICNRGSVKKIGRKDVASLLSLNLDTYLPHQCPSCKNHIPINTEIGSGGEFLSGSG